MTRRSVKPLNVDSVDDEIPALTSEAAKRSRFVEDIPALAHLVGKRGRGPQKAPVKARVTMRLDQEVIDFYKASGAGWQTRLNDDLIDVVRKAAQPPARPQRASGKR